MARQVGGDRFSVPAQGGGGRGGEAGLISSGTDSGRPGAGNEEPNRSGRDAAHKAVAGDLSDARSDRQDVAPDDGAPGDGKPGSPAPGNGATSNAAPDNGAVSNGAVGNGAPGDATPSAATANSTNSVAPRVSAGRGNSATPANSVTPGKSATTPGPSATPGNSATHGNSNGSDNSAPLGTATTGQRFGEAPAPGSEPHETTAHDAAAEISEGDHSATYRDVFRSREYRYLFSAIVLSLLGDQLAKVALSILVFMKTSSPLLTALSYGISYLPWVLGGPVLATFADRLPRRRVMIVCDVARAVLIGVLAIPGMPVPALLVLLLLASMFTPPFESARSALTTQILTGDVYVVGNGLAGTATQICNVVGLFAGGALVMVIHPRGALIADAATFLVSAGLIVFGVLERAVASRPAATSTWEEISAGARVVFGTPTLRSIILIVWISSVCSFAWEGIAVPWAHELGGGARTVGLLLGVSAAGTTVGSVIIGRVCPPRLRRRLILPLAVLAPALLGLVLADNALPLDVLVLIFSGFGMAFVIPLNAIFMQSLPIELRGRAFGVAQGGLQATQGMGVLAAGALVGAFSITTTVGVLGLIGAVATLAIGLLQPIRSD